jgi:hypothetical protein
MKLKESLAVNSISSTSAASSRSADEQCRALTSGFFSYSPRLGLATPDFLDCGTNIPLTLACLERPWATELHDWNKCRN